MCYKSHAMKSLRYLPLAYIAGVHGFAIFAPYAALVMAIFYLSHRRTAQV